jgi:hypothetical protein
VILHGFIRQRESYESIQGFTDDCFRCKTDRQQVPAKSGFRYVPAAIGWQKDEVIENVVLMEMLGRFLVLFKKAGESV